MQMNYAILIIQDKADLQRLIQGFKVWKINLIWLTQLRESKIDFVTLGLVMATKYLDTTLSSYGDGKKKWEIKYKRSINYHMP